MCHPHMARTDIIFSPWQGSYYVSRSYRFFSFFLSYLLGNGKNRTKASKPFRKKRRICNYEAYIHCFLLTKKHISTTSTPLSQSENCIHSRSLSFVSTEEEIVTDHNSLSFTKLESDKKKKLFYVWYHPKSFNISTALQSSENREWKKKQNQVGEPKLSRHHSLHISTCQKPLVSSTFWRPNLIKNLLCGNRQVRSRRESVSPKLVIHGCPAPSNATQQLQTLKNVIENCKPGFHKQNITCIKLTNQNRLIWSDFDIFF